MRENIVKNKSFAFAVRIVKLYQFLTDNKKEYVLSKQLLRSGTSVGAMVREAEHGYSPVERDEVYKDIFEQAENFKKNRMIMK